MTLVLIMWQYRFFLYWFHQMKCLIFTGTSLRGMKVWNFILLAIADLFYTKACMTCHNTERRKSLFTCTCASHISLCFSLQTHFNYHQRTLVWAEREWENVNNQNSQWIPYIHLSIIFSVSTSLGWHKIEILLLTSVKEMLTFLLISVLLTKQVIVSISINSRQRFMLDFTAVWVLRVRLY